MSQIADVVGIIGVVILLLAFFLLSTNKLSSKSPRYQWCNLIGASLILYSLIFSFNLASVMIEIAWVTISLIGLYHNRIASKKNSKSS